jgi:hypothetical protein
MTTVKAGEVALVSATIKAVPGRITNGRVIGFVIIRVIVPYSS